jgi:hypothetical protein
MKIMSATLDDGGTMSIKFYPGDPEKNIIIKTDQETFDKEIMKFVDRLLVENSKVKMSS